MENCPEKIKDVIAAKGGLLHINAHWSGMACSLSTDGSDGQMSLYVQPYSVHSDDKKGKQDH